MVMLIAAADTYGGYISPLKLAVVIGLFFAWIPLVSWVYRDAQEVQTNFHSWTIAVIGAGFGALVVWLLVPVFLVGLLLYVVAVGAVGLAYVVHRNGKVAEFEKVLTPQFFKGLFVNEGKKMNKASRGLSFITANGNEVPLPEPRTPEAMGFRLACDVFEDAIWRRASDLYFQPGAQEYQVTYSVDGVPAKQPARTREEMDHLIHYLKHLADLDTNERRKPQTGVFRISRDKHAVRWELTTAGSTAGEQVKVSVMEEYGGRKLEDLGFNADQMEPVRKLRDLEKGVILVTGPAKSGITTTLYALLRNHDCYMNNINTLEKRPSADLQNVTQHVYSLSDSGVTTYAKKLQTVMRTGPDIVGVADCEDDQCAYLVCAGARDGRVVYATMDAAGVVPALAKWLKLVNDAELAGSTLTAIINQRLVRKLCEQCRQAYEPNQDLFRKFNIPADKIKVLYRPGEVEYDKKGRPILCEGCQGTGFNGRTAIFETVVLDDKLRQVVRTAKDPKEIAAAFRKAGMLYMQEQAIKKVAQGVTSINEVIRHFSPKQKEGVAGQ